MQLVGDIFFTDSMLTLSEIFESDINYVNKLKNTKQSILDNIPLHFLDKTDNLYKDKFVSFDKSAFSFSNHLGYVNLFPMAFGIADKNLLNNTLDFINDEKHIWTPYGLASLTKQDELYGKEDNYWRGPIWINLNYLILRGIKLYYFDNEYARQTYYKLRENLINNISKEWKERGYFFEHYNQKYDGKGDGNRPFNGWTSLIALVIEEDY